MTSALPTASILGTGHYLPEQVVSNAALLAMSGLELKDYFFRRCVGIETRRFAASDQCTSDLAVEAAIRALADAGVDAADLRRIILATVSADYLTPATACRVQHRLGARNAAAIDLVGACSGFVFALDFAARCVSTGESPVLVVGADIRSRQLNLQDARTAFLYGDGAGAVVLGSDPSGENGILHSALMSDGRGFEEVYIPAGGSKEPITADAVAERRNAIRMPNGRTVARHALEGFEAVVAAVLAKGGCRLADIDFFIVHQPNRFLTEAVLERLGIPRDRVWLNFARYGNTTSASVPIALSEAAEAGRLADGSLVCVAAVGAGYSGGAHLVRWGRS